MSNRKAVSASVRRRLWCECMGHCMSPSCHKDLFPSDSTVAHKAHIEPYRIGNDNTFDNLIILCPNCHTFADQQPADEIQPRLRQWKAERNREIRARFSVRYASFSDLAQAVTPLLRRNRQIVDSYGPHADHAEARDRHELWELFENELMSNNERLLVMLSRNRTLLHIENQEIVEFFRCHVEEFATTRSAESPVRLSLFPSELNSVFGLETVDGVLPPSVAALQNLIARLIREDRFIHLELVHDQTLAYRNGEEINELHLANRPRIHQLYYNQRFYYPKTTSLRLDGLVYVLRCLYRRRVEYTTPDPRRLWELRLGDRYDVALCYEYCLSEATLNDLLVSDPDMVVNLHNWNGGPVSKAAEELAQSCHVPLHNQQSFFSWVRSEFG